MMECENLLSTVNLHLESGVKTTVMKLRAEHIYVFS